MKFIEEFLKKRNEKPELAALEDCRGTILTNEQMDLMSGRVYRYLHEQGIGREDFVCILLPRGVWPFVAAMGTWKAGAAFVLLEEGYPAERVAYIQQDCNCRLLIDSGLWEEILKCEPLEGYEEVQDHDAAFAVYTSGSTGNPKGVLHEYGSIDLIAACWTKEVYRFGLPAPLNFIASLELFILGLQLSVTLLVIPREVLQDPKLLEPCFIKNDIQSCFCTPSVYPLFRRIRTLKVISIGAEPAYGIWSDDPELSVYFQYAMSESGFIIATNKLDRPNEAASIGRPNLSLRLELLDEDGQPVPEGEIGEICFENPFFRGYINRPEETARAFRGGIFHSGDMGRLLPDGNYIISGRADDMVKINGNRVEPAEIEMAFRRITGIDMVLAKGFIEGDTAWLCLYYEAKTPVDPDTIREKLKKELPYYMIPARFVRMDSLPRTKTGKLSRRLLEKPAMEEAVRSYVPPENEEERILCDSMAEILKLERVSAEDDFYEIGGSSITSMALATGCPLSGLSTDLIFAGRTPRSIVSLWRERRKEAAGAETKGADLSEPWPLTQTQLGIYLDCERMKGEAVYNNPLLLCMPPEVNTDRIRKALELTLPAHPALFARILTGEDGMPAMQYDPARLGNLCGPVMRLTDEAFAEKKKMLCRPFDLSKDRLFRAELYQTEKQLYLFLDFHHIIYDGTSGHILMHELARALQGEAPRKETYTAFDLARDEELERRSGKYSMARAWMLEEFGSIEGTALPEGDLRGKRTVTGRKRIPLSVSLEAFRSFCTLRQITENVVSTAAFGYLLSVYRRGKDVAFSTIYNGRKDDRTARTVAMMVRTLPVRCRIGRDQTVHGYLTAVRDQMLGAMAHDIFSFAELAEQTGISGDVQFAWQDEMHEIDPAGVNISAEDVPFNATGEALSVDLLAHEGRLVMDISFHANRYSERFIETLAGAYSQILQGLITRKKLSELRLMNSEERERVLQLSRGDELPYDAEETWIDLFQKQVEKAPEHPAVTDRDSSYTYRELDEASDRIAEWLIRNGVKPDTFVAIRMGRVKEFIAAEMGIHKAGLGYVPIDPEYPEERIAFMLEDSGAPLILTEEKVQEILAESAREGAAEASVPEETVADRKSKASTAAVWDGRSLATPDSLAYMIYTSGTTGQPKGVVIVQRCLTNYAHVIGKRWQLSEKSRITIHAGLAVDFAGEDLFPTLCAGGSVYIVPEEVRKDVLLMREYLTEHRITGGSFYTQFGQLLGKDAELDLDYISIGGEAMTGIPKVRGRVLNAYGPTEFTVDAVFHEIDPKRKYDTIPIGRPLDNCAGYIMDDGMRLLPAGMTGELCLAGPQIAQGYWKRPELTAEKFCESGDIPGIRVYRTGDLARYNERGELEYLGRIDTQVKLRGFRIELGEIENRAVRYAGIREACAEVRQEQLVLYYTLQEKIQTALFEDEKDSPGNTLQMKAGSAEAEGTDFRERKANAFREGLRTFLSEQLADYMVPTVYMELDTMPLTPAGKINRKALPEPERVNRGELILPQTPLQEQLCSIFREELTLEEVGINENFFEIGGNSIRAMKVLLKMMVKGLPLNYQDLYDHPRVDELEQLIYEKQSRKKEGTRDGSLSGVEGAEEKTLTCLSRNRVEYLEDLAFRELGNILLVGATGFLGAHLLKKLLEETRGTIYCLIRPGRLGALKRLHEIMFYYFEDTFDHFLGDRLVLIEGDILSDEIMEKVGTYDIQTVINCAADVRHFADIDSLMLANVKLVDRLIELCIEKNARLIHTSTTSVAGSAAGEKGTQAVLREDKLELGQYTEDNGYVHTKFIAEKHVLTAVEERGLDAKIMRLGNLMSRATDGEFQMNFNTNNFFRTLWAFAELECIPFSILTDEEEISPVDEVAEAMVRLSGTDSRFTVFHPYNCHRIRLGDIVYAMERAGYPIKPVNDDEFRIRVHEGIADPDTGVVLSPLFMYDTDRDDQMINIQTDNDFTTMALYRLGFNWSMTDMNYLEVAIRNVGELRL